MNNKVVTHLEIKQKYDDLYEVQVKDSPGLSAVGRTPAEAIFDLISYHTSYFGLGNNPGEEKVRQLVDKLTLCVTIEV